MKIAKRTKLRAATVLGAAALGIGLAAGPAAAASYPVKLYSSAKSCKAAANAAGPGYWCKSQELDGRLVFWLMVNV